MRIRSTGIVSAALFIAAFACAARAQQRTLVLAPSQDNTLYQDAAGSLSNGSGAHFFAGLSGSGLRRGLLEFELAPLPRTALVLEAHLSLNLSRTAGGPSTISLHRVLAAWGEGSSDAAGEEGGGAPAAPGDATWLHRFFSDMFWSAAGGEFDPASSGQQIVADIGIYEWSSQEMAADVQDWSLNRSANFGWILIGDEQTAGNTKRFDSRENLDPALRPQLRIEYFLRCPWDLNESGMIDVADLAILLSHFGATDAGPLDGDIDDDGDVDLADLAAELSWFGRVCPP